MESIIDIAKATIPSLIVIYGAYLIVKSFLDKSIEENKISKSVEQTKEILPLRLQAYERIVIFLERLAPNNLIIRLNDSSYSAVQFQNILVHEIREEFNHNLSQQIYMSDQSWGLVKKCMEEVIALINNSGQELKPDATSLDLAKKIFENLLAEDSDIIGQAQSIIKNEIRAIF
ncbi:hypothetical protein [Flexithrix dorotheae]|uniref:DUF7935 family protein n=1 Tax=Flexithrix dorotheae TaxID=70993 RepID=UPI00036DB052|nr:hypothetical protein [Flexithrix dorotheae]